MSEIRINILDKNLKISNTYIFNKDKNLKVFLYDNVYELQKKIFAAVNIPIFKQHICYQTKPKAQFVSLNYSIKLIDTNINFKVDISDLLNNNSNFNVNISTIGYENKNNLQIIDKTNTLISELQTLEFFVLNMDLFINNNLDNIKQPIYLDLYYYGCVIIYWPMLSYDTFNALITDINLFTISYPMLSMNKNNVETEVKKQISLFENMKFNKYDINNLKINNKNIIINIKTLMYDTVYKLSNINTRLLFEKLHINDDKKVVLPIQAILLLNTFYNNKYINIVKTDRKNIANIKNILFKCNSIFNISHNKAKPDVTDCLFIFFENIILFLAKNNCIKINYIASGDDVINLLNIFDIVASSINPYLKLLSIPEITKKSVIISNLSLSIIWNLEIVSVDIFQYIINFLEQYCKINAMKNVTTAIDQLKFTLYTGIKNLENDLPFNQFSYLSDLKSNVHWSTNICVGQLLLFNYIFKYIRINLPQIEIANIDMLFSFIDYFTSNLLNEDILKNIKKNKIVNVPLKLIDPVLYNLDNKMLYSRKCQKKNQPEISFIPQKNYVKYWNFTTKSPIYYVCPNPKYSHFGFITGIHSKNYCVPCCNRNIKKNTTIYNTCIKDHMFLESKDTKNISRYITNYGKYIEYNRLGQLPKELSQYFITKNNELIKEVILEDYFIYDGKRYNASIYANGKQTLVENKYLVKFLNKLTFQYKTYYDILQTYFSNTEKKNYFINYLKKIGYQPLILLLDENKHYVLLWHRFMLLKYFINKYEKIPCVIVKELVNPEDVEEKEVVENKELYMYGVQQFFNEINISVLYILAMVLKPSELALHNFTESTVGANDVNTAINEVAVNTSDVAVFEIINDIIDKLKNNEVFLNKINSQYNINLIQELINITVNSISQINWNMIFMEIIESLYKVKVFLFYMENDNLFIHYISNNRYENNLVIYKFDNYYYPIYEFNLTEFFKKSSIKIKLFDINHNLIITIYNMIDYLIKGDFMSLFLVFLKNNNIKILKYFKNKKNIVYMLLLDYNGEHILFPIDNPFVIDNIKSETHTRGMATIEYKNLIIFLNKLQQYLNDNYYHLETYTETKKIIYKKKQIGIICNDLYFYHNSKPENDNERNTESINIKYDIDNINNIILGNDTNNIFNDNIQFSYYLYYLYYLFSLQIVSNIDIERDITKGEVSKFFHITNADIKINDFPNILCACSAAGAACNAAGKDSVAGNSTGNAAGKDSAAGNASYCNGNKLVISTSNFNKFYEIFKSNVNNPNKKMYYKNLQNNIIINNFFKFSLFKNEVITIVNRGDTAYGAG